MNIKLDVTQKFRSWEGKEEFLIVKDDEGKDLPLEKQMTVGRVLLQLLATIDPTTVSVEESVTVNRVGMKLGDAVDKGEVYEIGEIPLAILRKAVTQNRIKLGVLVIGQLAEILLMEKEKQEKGAEKPDG